MWWKTYSEILSSNALQNILIIISLVIAFTIGIRQIWINDVVELYATYSGGDNSIHIQNVGTRLVYLDEYVFNGKDYLLSGQILPSSYAQSGAFYYINLPRADNLETHVSIEVSYHDLDDRKWKSLIIADRENSVWKIKTLPREVL